MPLPELCGEPMERMNKKPRDLLNEFIIEMAKRFPHANISVKLRALFFGRGYLQNDAKAVIIVSFIFLKTVTRTNLLILMHNIAKRIVAYRECHL